MQGEHLGERERKSTMIVQERIKARSQTISLHPHTQILIVHRFKFMPKGKKAGKHFRELNYKEPTHTHKKKRFIIIHVTSGEWPCDPRMPRIISKQWKHVTMELQAIYLQ